MNATDAHVAAAARRAVYVTSALAYGREAPETRFAETAWVEAKAVAARATVGAILGLPTL